MRLSINELSSDMVVHCLFCARTNEKLFRVSSKRIGRDRPEQRGVGDHFLSPGTGVGHQRGGTSKLTASFCDLKTTKLVIHLFENVTCYLFLLSLSGT